MAKYIPTLLDCLFEIDPQKISSNRGKLADLGIISPEDFSKTTLNRLLEVGLTQDQLDKISQYLIQHNLRGIRGYNPIQPPNVIQLPVDYFRTS